MVSRQADPRQLDRATPSPVLHALGPDFNFFSLNGVCRDFYLLLVIIKIRSTDGVPLTYS